MTRELPRARTANASSSVHGSVRSEIRDADRDRDGDRDGDEDGGRNSGQNRDGDSDKDSSHTRRRFLQSVGAGALVGALGAPRTTAQTDPTSFVETDGTQFVVDGEPIYFHGANNFWITDAFRGTEDRIDDLFEQFEEMGINFVRTFVTCEGGDEDGDCYIPEPYEHSEGAFETLDYIISRAADHGIRLTLILADNWDHNGGIPQYIDWIDSADHHGDFYVDENARDLYKWHVEEVLTRENTITGREYREEPSIAMWELCNEPRLEGDAFGEGEDPGYEERASILEDWIEEMSGFIKDIDSNHLVSTGMEGFYTRADRTEWFYDEWTGQDFIRHHSIDTIDACSFHLYPYHWDVPLEYGSTWIREHVKDAHEAVGKPGYCGEFNVNIDSGLETRNETLGEWYEVLDAVDADAAMIWQVVLEEMHDHDGFQVYRSETGDVLATYAQATSAKSVAEGETELAAPTSVVTTTTGTSITVDWSRVSWAVEYAVSVDGSGEQTTSATSAVIDGLSADVEYEVGVSAVGADGSETNAVTTTATTEGPDTVGYPEWEYGTVYEEGDRVVWNGIVWEAQWYTDEAEPRFESGYAWEFVRVIGVVERDSDSNSDSDSDSNSDSGSDNGDSDGPPAIDGSEPADTTGDGRYNDITDSGQTTTTDVNVFFEHVDDPAITEYPDYYDFDGNGQVSVTDVVDLFDSL